MALLKVDYDDELDAAIAGRFDGRPMNEIDCMVHEKLMTHHEAVISTVLSTDPPFRHYANQISYDGKVFWELRWKVFHWFLWEIAVCYWRGFIDFVTGKGQQHG